MAVSEILGISKTHLRKKKYGLKKSLLSNSRMKLETAHLEFLFDFLYQTHKIAEEKATGVWRKSNAPPLSERRCGTSGLGSGTSTFLRDEVTSCYKTISAISQ